MVERSSGVIEQLLKAAQLEIVAARRDDAKTADKASLTTGERIAGDGANRYEYLFSCRAWPDSFEDVGLVIRPARGRGEWAPAEITASPDGRRRVITEADLGAQPPNIQVREDDAAGWEKLAARLQAAVDKPDSADLQAAGWLLGDGRPSLRSERAVARLVAGWEGLLLNTEQRAAVEQALGSDVLFLWGPPGTGKTDVVSHIIEGCYRQDLRVLFLAPTNVAVDQALHRICRLLQAEDGFDEGLVQRSGKIALTSLAASYGNRIRPEEIAERLSADLKQEAELLVRQSATVSAQLAALRRVQALEHDRDAAAGQWHALDQHSVHVTGLAAGAEATIAHLTDEMTRLESSFSLRRQSRLDRLADDLGQVRANLEAHRRQLHDSLPTRLRRGGRMTLRSRRSSSRKTTSPACRPLRYSRTASEHSPSAPRRSTKACKRSPTWSAVVAGSWARPSPRPSSPRGCWSASMRSSLTKPAWSTCRPLGARRAWLGSA